MTGQFDHKCWSEIVLHARLCDRLHRGVRHHDNLNWKLTEALINQILETFKDIMNGRVFVLWPELTR
jgi:hypothetical protein